MHVLSFTTLTRGAERCHSSIFGTSNKADGTSMLRTSAVGIILTYIYHVDIEPSTVECLNTPDLNRSTDSKINMLSVIHMLLRFSWVGFDNERQPNRGTRGFPLFLNATMGINCEQPRRVNKRPTLLWDRPSCMHVSLCP